jgi:hypothetical protein
VQARAAQAGPSNCTKSSRARPMAGPTRARPPPRSR